MSVRVNPKMKPSPRAIEVAAEIAANGGTLTAEEWEFSQHYGVKGSTSSRTRAIQMAGPGGAIVGRPGSWSVYTRRTDTQ